MKKLTVSTTMMAALLAAGAHAQTQTDDRAAQNRAAVRQMFPVVKLFDGNKKTSAAQPTLATPSTSATRPTSTAATDAAGAANQSFAAVMKGRAAVLSIAGVKVGMTRVEALAAAKAAGFSRLVSTGRSLATFQDKVNIARGQIDHGFVYQLDKQRSVDDDVLDGANGQQLTIFYAQMPAGALVSSVAYTISESVMDVAALKRATIAKYGKPDEDGTLLSHTLMWCGGPCRHDGMGHEIVLNLYQGPSQQRLDLSARNLFDDESMRLAHERAVELVGKTTKPAF